MMKPIVATVFAGSLLASTAAFAQSSPTPSAQGSTGSAQQSAASQSDGSQGQAVQFPQSSNHPSRLIVEVQKQLSDDGYLTGTANGIWDDETGAALKNFQDQHGLDATGKIDMVTLLALGVSPGTMVSGATNTNEMTGEETAGQSENPRTAMSEQLGAREHAVETMAYERGFEAGFQHGIQEGRQQAQAGGRQGQRSQMEGQMSGQTQGQGSSQPSFGQRFIIVPSP
jgi:peptidoglycan hydrolase-like protein with peptidoglycan-binding domain